MTPPDTLPRQALGRGLAALVPSVGSPAAASMQRTEQRHVPIEKIYPNKSQPRKIFDSTGLDELAESIKICGILQPIVVRQISMGYEIVAGERRWRAASRAGVQLVPIVVKDFDPCETLCAALVENIQRADLDPLEEAEAYTRLVRDHGMTQAEVATAVGKSRSAVANAMRLLQLPKEVLTFLAQGKLTAGHARALMTLDNDADIERIAQEAMRQSMSVRDLEARARTINQSAKASKQPTKTPADTSVEERLMGALGTKVRLHHRKGKGRIEIFFHSLDQLDDLLNRFAPQ